MILVGRGTDSLERGEPGGGPAQEITLSNAFIMTGTQLTVRSGIFNYTYNNSTAEPPASGQARVECDASVHRGDASSGCGSCRPTGRICTGG